uniref:DUF962 domain-containing protein n=1 Tax=Vannella robusta TaxID=1487602 RepID=A0A7S4MAP8_9EUKA
MSQAVTRTDYKTFKDFYPYYLEEHSNQTNRRLHVIGTLSATLSLILILFTMQLRLLWVPLLIGYGFAWVGHFFFEKNKPATFKYPLFSLRGDWKMLAQVLTGKIAF